MCFVISTFLLWSSSTASTESVGGALHEPLKDGPEQAELAEALVPSISASKMHSNATGLEVMHQAGRHLAQTLATLVADELRYRDKEEAAVERLDNLAKSLRGNAEEISRRGASQIVEAARKAAQREVQADQTRDAKLDERAASATLMAKQRRDRARAAMQRVLEAQKRIMKEMQDVKAQTSSA